MSHDTERHSVSKPEMASIETCLERPTKLFEEIYAATKTLLMTDTYKGFYQFAHESRGATHRPIQWYDYEKQVTVINPLYAIFLTRFKLPPKISVRIEDLPKKYDDWAAIIFAIANPKTTVTNNSLFEHYYFDLSGSVGDEIRKIAYQLNMDRAAWLGDRSFFLDTMKLVFETMSINIDRCYRSQESLRKWQKA